MAVRLIDVGSFFTRMEGSIATNFILAGIIKLLICLLAATKGTAALFHVEDERKLVLPVSLLVVALAAIVYNNVMISRTKLSFSKKKPVWFTPLSLQERYPSAYFCFCLFFSCSAETS